MHRIHGVFRIAVAADRFRKVRSQHRAAGQDPAPGRLFLQQGDGLLHGRHRRGHERGKARYGRVQPRDRFQDRLRFHVLAQVRDVEPVAFQKQTGDILADVVDVALHCRHDHRAPLFSGSGR